MKVIIILAVIALSFIISVILTKKEIPVLKLKAGQNIREEGLRSHYSKAGTPSMGGISIILATGIVYLTVLLLTGERAGMTVLVLLVFAGFGLIGFFDDYLKVIKKQNEGLKAYQKFGCQLVISVVFAVAAVHLAGLGTDIYIPGADVYVDLGMFYVPFIVFVVLAMTNAVNLTDGLDGLASGITVIVSLFFMIAGAVMGLASGMYFFAALCGGCLGFLVFNRNPAKVFMGDTGSLAIGGGIAAASIVMKLELFLLIAGLIFVIEALSVVLQVGYFKISGGRRIFKMAPIHHHFEKCGYRETQVVPAFWIFTAVCCAVSVILVLI